MMTTDVLASRACAVKRRISLRFAPDGQSAACLAAGDDGRLFAERWSWRDSEPTATVRRCTTEETARSQVIPTPDGAVLALRLGAGVHQLVLLRPGPGQAGESLLEVLTLPAARLLPSPGTAIAGVMITGDRCGSRIWQVTAGPVPRLRLALEAGKALGGGVWLDDEGRLVSVQCEFGGRIVPAVADLREGTIVPDPYLAPVVNRAAASPVIVWAAHRATGLRLVARLGAARPLSLVGPGMPCRTPAALNSIAESIQPLDFSPDGRRLALHATSGVRSRVYEYDIDRDAIAEISIPDGAVRSGGAWSRGGLRFLFSGPHLPAGLAAVCADRSWRLDGTSRQPGAVHVRNMAGPAGPIESIIYGGAGWLTAPQLVLGLHGGPSERWSLAYDSLFAGLSLAGVAVLAPNQRGSIGYGPEHREAIVGAWAGADLDDVISIGQSLCARRRAAGLDRPVLYGTSYGAFLAMAAVALRPDLWRGCVAIAPFLSAPRLRRDAAQQVRSMLDRLKACELTQDGAAPRDLADLFAAGPAEPDRTPVYLIHGLRDGVIPATHSRELANVLRRVGWTDGIDLFHREVPDAGHDPFASGAEGADIRESVIRFIRHGTSHPPEPFDRGSTPP